MGRPNYKSSTIDAALWRVRAIPRALALKKVAKPNQTKRPVHAVTLDPRLPNLSEIQNKHWRSTSPYLKEVYPEPPLTAYTQVFQVLVANLT